MLDYFRKQAEELPPQHGPFKTSADWERHAARLRERLWQSLGDFPRDDRPPLRSRQVGTIEAADYVIEKIVYESLPDLFVTALVYRPKEIRGRVPAVLYLNGHFPEAKATPDIQKCCIALARQGVIAFCQDVIGTGERAAPAGSPHATYHGNYRGGVSLIVGRSLLGYVMYECTRALDYLESRPDVDPERIVCTGASGGGKQSLFLPALDKRIAGSVPVCYVSSYHAHLGATACVGEVLTDALRYTDQWEILALNAPFPVLCICASQDAPVFQPRHMLEAVAKAREQVYALYKSEQNIHGEVVDSPHAYNQPMRELLYSFVATTLKGEPPRKIAEPADISVRTATELACGLPRDSATIPSLTYSRARVLSAAIKLPNDADEWQTQKQRILSGLEQDILKCPPAAQAAQQTLVSKRDWQGHSVEQWTIEPEPGIVLPAALCFPKHLAAGDKAPAVIVADEGGKQRAFERGVVTALLDGGAIVLAIDLRGLGETAGTVPAYNYESRGLEDYNLHQYSLFLGRTLMGKRVSDLRSAVDFLSARPHVSPDKLAVIGRGHAAFAGLLAAAVDERIRAVATEEMLATYVFPEEFDGIGMSYLIPGILKQGDVPHFVAALAPRPLLLLNGVNARRELLPATTWARDIGYPLAIYRQHDASSVIQAERLEPDAVPARLARWVKDVWQMRTP